MARKIVEVLTSDLSGEQGTGIETVKFSIDGKHYEIELTEEEAQELRDLLSAYMSAGRRAAGSRSPRPTSTVSNVEQQTGVKPAVVRKWAGENGYDVPARGRIPQEVIEAFNADTPEGKQAS